MPDSKKAAMVVRRRSTDPRFHMLVTGFWILFSAGSATAAPPELRLKGAVGGGAGPYSSVGSASSGGAVMAGAVLEVAPLERHSFRLDFLYRGYDRGYRVVTGTTTADNNEVLRESLFAIGLSGDLWTWDVGRLSVSPVFGFSFFLFENNKVPSMAAGPSAGLRLNISLPKGFGVELAALATVDVMPRRSADDTSTQLPYHGEVSWGGVGVKPGLWWRSDGQRFGVGLSYYAQLFGMDDGEFWLHHGATAMLEYRFGVSTAPASLTVSRPDNDNDPTEPTDAEAVCAGHQGKLEDAQLQVITLKKDLAACESRCSISSKGPAKQQCKPCPATTKCPKPTCPKCKACRAPKKCMVPQPRPPRGVSRAKLKQELQKLRRAVDRLEPTNTRAIRKEVRRIADRIGRF